MTLLRPRSRWPAAQARFRQRFTSNPGRLHDHSVHIRWFTARGDTPATRATWFANAPAWTDLTPVQIFALATFGILGALWLVEAPVLTVPLRIGVSIVAVGLLALVLRGPTDPCRRAGAGRRFVAVYRPDAPLRAAPTLVFEVDRSSFASRPAGQGAAVLFGRISPRSTLCLVHEGIASWPVAPPVRRMSEAPGR